MLLICDVQKHETIRAQIKNFLYELHKKEQF